MARQTDNEYLVYVNDLFQSNNPDNVTAESMRDFFKQTGENSLSVDARLLGSVDVPCDLTATPQTFDFFDSGIIIPAANTEINVDTINNQLVVGINWVYEVSFQLAVTGANFVNVHAAIFVDDGTGFNQRPYYTAHSMDGTNDPINLSLQSVPLRLEAGAAVKIYLWADSDTSVTIRGASMTMALLPWANTYDQQALTLPAA